jgi:hypothetical protein
MRVRYLLIYLLSKINVNSTFYLTYLYEFDVDEELEPSNRLEMWRETEEKNKSHE